MKTRHCHRLIVGLFSLSVLAAVDLTAGLVQADSVGPYYGMPSWDQTLPSATRFIILSNFNSEAVLDRNTGLVWEKSPTRVQASGQTWAVARLACANSTVGGQKGWRLASLPELTSLVDPTQSSPSLPLGHPFTNVQFATTDTYWSATKYAEAANPTLAWIVSFGSGNVAIFNVNFGSQLWCVRGGMNAEAY